MATLAYIDPAFIAPEMVTLEYGQSSLAPVLLVIASLRSRGALALCLSETVPALAAAHQVGTPRRRAVALNQAARKKPSALIWAVMSLPSVVTEKS